jgi:hypothetical protein
LPSTYQKSHLKEKVKNGHETAKKWPHMTHETVKNVQKGPQLVTILHETSGSNGL